MLLKAENFDFPEQLLIIIVYYIMLYYVALRLEAVQEPVNPFDTTIDNLTQEEST